MTKIVLVTQENVSLTKYKVDLLCALILEFFGIHIMKIETFEDVNNETISLSEVRDPIKHAVTYLSHTTEYTEKDDFEFYIALLLCMNKEEGYNAVEILAKSKFSDAEKKFLQNNWLTEQRLKTIKEAFKRCETSRNQK